MDPINFKEIKKAMLEKIRQEYGNDFSEEEINKLAGQMIYYINSGSPYGYDTEGFLKWYIERGGKLHERN